MSTITYFPASTATVSVSNARKIHVAAGARVVFVGDSTSRESGPYFWGGNGFLTSLNATLSSPIVNIDEGVDGDHLANLLTNVTTRISDHNPDVVFIAIGTNDMGVDNTTWAANYVSLITAILAVSPACQIGAMSIFARGEVWAAGPVWSGNIDDAELAIKNPAISAACINRAVYVDTRTLLLPWEVTNNPSKLAFGVATQPDGIHPSEAGKAALGTFAMTYVG